MRVRIRTGSHRGGILSTISSFYRKSHILATPSADPQSVDLNAASDSGGCLFLTLLSLKSVREIQLSSNRTAEAEFFPVAIFQLSSPREVVLVRIVHFHPYLTILWLKRSSKLSYAQVRTASVIFVQTRYFPIYNMRTMLYYRMKTQAIRTSPTPQKNSVGTFEGTFYMFKVQNAAAGLD